MLVSYSRSARRRPLISFFLALAILTTGWVLGGSSVAWADDIDAISGGPSNGTTQDARTRFSYQVEPGQQIEDYYIAKNTGTTSQTLTVFGTDAFNAEDGGFSLLDTNEQPKDAGSWITFSGGVSRVELPLGPGESAVVPFTLSVPADASPGDHPGGIVISVTSGAGQVLVDKRFATRLYVRVKGDLQALLRITKFSSVYTPTLNPLSGSVTITATIKNEGNVALGGKVDSGVKTWGGIAATNSSLVVLDELLPGSTREVTYTLDGVGQWGYLNPYVSIQPSVDVNAQNPGAIAQVSRDAVLFAVPWWLLVVLILVVLIWLFSRIRRARDEKAAAEWIAYTEAEAKRRAEESADSDDTSNALSEGSR